VPLTDRSRSAGTITGSIASIARQAATALAKLLPRAAVAGAKGTVAGGKGVAGTGLVPDSLSIIDGLLGWGGVGARLAIDVPRRRRKPLPRGRPATWSAARRRRQRTDADCGNFLRCCCAPIRRWRASSAARRLPQVHRPPDPATPSKGIAMPLTETRTTPADYRANATGLNVVDWIALVLMIVGGINWGLVGLLNIDLVATLFGTMSTASRVVYALVGIAALYGIVLLFQFGRKR
jgi:uncharacterized protein